MRWIAQVVAALVFTGEAGAYTFGGFDAAESEFLKRGADDQVCAPAPKTSCRAVDKKEARGFAKPPRTRKLSDEPIAVTIEDEKNIKVAAGDRVIATWSPGARVISVNANVFVSPGGTLIAIEYETAGKQADVVAFPVATAPRAEKLPARAPAEDGRTAYDRALKLGGVWEQRQVPCDQAGVTLSLKKTRRFGIKIVTRCQGQKSTVELAGTFVTEGSDTLVLEFENEEGPLERLECRFAACRDVSEDCLTCSQEDITFTMQVVRR